MSQPQQGDLRLLDTPGARQLLEQPIPARMAGPVRAENLVDPQADPLPWSTALDAFGGTEFYWLATTHHSRGTPHVRPVLAVVVSGRVFTTSGPYATKARSLDHDPSCALTSRIESLDVVLEGRAHAVVDDATLESVAHEYRATYDWPVTIRAGAFEAPYGAPTAGPGPYDVYEIELDRAYGFGTDEANAPQSTRWILTNDD